MSRTYHRARRAAGTALLAVFLILPFLRVNGESALRFDVPTLRLLFFGTVIWMEDFFIVLVAVLALTFLTLFLTTAFGRIWCGWLCPQTVLVDLSPFLDRLTGKGVARRAGAYLLAAAASMAIASSIVGYFVPPYEIAAVIRAGGTASSVVTGSWLVLFLLVLLDILALRRTFCRTVCPYAKLQSVLFDDRTLVVAFDGSRKEECQRCAACVRACPVGIDIRRGLQMECIHCAECVDACTVRMASCSRSSLVSYRYGVQGGKAGGLRISLYLSGGLAAAAVLYFLYLTAVRVPFEASVSPVQAGAVTASAAGVITNHYLLVLRNTRSADLDLVLSVTGPAGRANARPDRIRLAMGNDSIQVPLVITVDVDPGDGRRYLALNLVLRQEGEDRELRKPLSFPLPQR